MLVDLCNRADIFSGSRRHRDNGRLLTLIPTPLKLLAGEKVFPSYQSKERLKPEFMAFAPEPTRIMGCPLDPVASIDLRHQVLSKFWPIAFEVS